MQTHSTPDQLNEHLLLLLPEIALFYSQFAFLLCPNNIVSLQPLLRPSNNQTQRTTLPPMSRVRVSAPQLLSISQTLVSLCSAVQFCSRIHLGWIAGCALLKLIFRK